MTAQAAHLGLSTPANLITLTRLAASPVLFWLILRAADNGGASWEALGLGGAFAASDAWDGRLARNTGTVTRTGAFLDPLADKVVVLGAMACLATVGRVSWVPVALIAGREVWMSGFRFHFARRGLAVPARRSAKWKVILQGLAVALTLVPPLAVEDAPVREGIVTGVWWLAVVATGITGLLYLRDGRKATSTSGSTPGGAR